MKRRSRRPAGRRPRSTRARGRQKATQGSPGLAVREVVDLESFREEIERAAKQGSSLRWNPDADDVQRSVVKLVLTLIEFVRKLMERQAVRRLEEGTLTTEETEAVGTALMKLEQTIHAIGAQFKLDPEDLNLDLGPIGKLM